MCLHMCSVLQDIVGCLMALVEVEVASAGQVLHPQPLLQVLMPLLFVLEEAHAPHLRHLLAAVLR